MKIAKKIILFGLCAALLIGASVLGTMAYLQSQSETATYSVGIGNVYITLADAAAPSDAANEDATVSTEVSPHKLIPGTTIAMAPKVTVKAGSQACWLFVKVVEEDVKIGENTYKCTDFLSYAIETGWTKLEIANEIIYYRQVAANAADQVFGILAGDPDTTGKWAADQLYVKETVTEEMLNALGTEKPALIFSAYAIQSNGFATAADAWNALMAQTAPATTGPAASESANPEA